MPTRFGFTQKQILGGAIAIVAIVSLGFLLPAVIRLDQDTAALHKSPTEENEREFNASLERVKAIVGGIGTIATIAGGIVLYLNFKVANRSADMAADRLVSERFSKAVEMLGNDKSIHIRLGGIYALESIANDSRETDDYYRQVMEVLTAFVRERSPWPSRTPSEQNQETTTVSSITEQINRADHSPKTPQQPKTEQKQDEKTDEETIPTLPTDIQAVLRVLTALNQRQYANKESEKHPLDLRRTDLRKAYLEEAHLEGANLGGANLQRAEIWKAHLEEAKLGGANLQRAKLREAYLQKAYLGGSHLEEARLGEAHLEEARLGGAHLEEARLEGAYLQKAYLGGAHLKEAILEKAHLKGAIFWNPKLTGNELAHAKQEAKTNLQSATGWETAHYNSEIREWLGLPPETSEPRS